MSILSTLSAVMLGGLEITPVFHGCIMMKADDEILLVDPIFEYEGIKAVYPECSASKVTILITHDHFDHCCPQMVNAIISRVGLENVCIVGSYKAIDKLLEESEEALPESDSLELPQMYALANGDTLDLSFASQSLHIEAVPAYNTTPGRDKYHSEGVGNGYVLDFDSKRIYISGDSEYVPALQDIDLAFLATNQPYTMTAAQCIAAAKSIHPKILVPYHLTDTDTAPIVEAFKDSDIMLYLK